MKGTELVKQVQDTTTVNYYKKSLEKKMTDTELYHLADEITSTITIKPIHTDEGMNKLLSDIKKQPAKPIWGESHNKRPSWVENKNGLILEEDLETKEKYKTAVDAGKRTRMALDLKEFKKECESIDNAGNDQIMDYEVLLNSIKKSDDDGKLIMSNLNQKVEKIKEKGEKYRGEQADQIREEISNSINKYIELQTKKLETLGVKCENFLENWKDDINCLYDVLTAVDCYPRTLSCVYESFKNGLIPVLGSAHTDDLVDINELAVKEIDEKTIESDYDETNKYILINMEKEIDTEMQKVNNMMKNLEQPIKFPVLPTDSRERILTEGNITNDKTSFRDKLALEEKQKLMNLKTKKLINNLEQPIKFPVLPTDSKERILTEGNITNDKTSFRDKLALKERQKLMNNNKVITK